MTLRSSVARACAPRRPSGKTALRLGCGASLLGGALLLSACGQKGPLTLPANAAAAPAAAPASGASR